MQHSWQASVPEDLPAIVPELLSFAAGQSIFLMHGNLGAGKTTLIKEICRYLGVKEVVNSPTFSIVQEYQTEAGDRIYHFDLYRVKNQAELFDLGFENYLDSGSYCFIEWPEKAEGLFYQPKADIFITVENDIRVISCNYE